MDLSLSVLTSVFRRENEGAVVSSEGPMRPGAGNSSMGRAGEGGGELYEVWAFQHPLTPLI